MARVEKTTGAAFAGSQRQTQLWVNERTADLNQAVMAKLPPLASGTIEWVSPLAKDKHAEPQDRAFLDCLGLGAHDDDLTQFWPRRGPVWDALAKATTVDGKAAVLLAEGKSYPGEMYDRQGCTASAPESLKLIAQSLAETQQSLGLAANPKLWMGSLYQTANRLAHAFWLRQNVGVEAWVVNLLFTGDTPRKTTEAEWDVAVAKAYSELGLPAEVPSAVHVVLPAVKSLTANVGSVTAPEE